jgi:hypothetical protein
VKTEGGTLMMTKNSGILFKGRQKKRVKKAAKESKDDNRMNRNKQEDVPKTQEEVLKKAFDDMCRGLNKFGPKEILNLMVIHSHRDEVVHQLLIRYPTVVAIGDFLSTLPVREVNRRTLKRLQRSGCIV